MENTNKTTKNTTENTAIDNVLTIFGTEKVSQSLDIAGKTFHGLPISNALAVECNNYIKAELIERQAKIRKGMALYTIKANGLACIYTVDENGKPYAKDKKTNDYTKTARERMFNRFVGELGIPQSTANRLIGVAKMCCEEKTDDKTGLIKLYRVKNIERLPESCIMHAYSLHLPRETLENFINDVDNLNFKTANEFENAYKAYIKRTSERLGIQANEDLADNATENSADNTTENSTDSTAENSNTATTENEYTTINFAYPKNIETVKAYSVHARNSVIFVPARDEGTVETCGLMINSAANNIGFEDIDVERVTREVNEQGVKDNMHLYVVSARRVNAKGETLYLYVDTFAVPIPDVNIKINYIK